jgi:hypothetical protein
MLQEELAALVLLRDSCVGLKCSRNEFSIHAIKKEKFVNL